MFFKGFALFLKGGLSAAQGNMNFYLLAMSLVFCCLNT